MRERELALRRRMIPVKGSGDAHLLRRQLLLAMESAHAHC
jgi:hypothetical protein